MLVGLDTSPLTLTRAGTARYVTNLLAGLEQEPDIEVKTYSWGGDGKPTKVARDMGWYRFSLPRAARRDGVDVLHCTSMRAPFRSAMPLVVTIHDAAVLRFPETFNRWTRNYSANALPRVVRSADVIVTGSEFTRDELGTLLKVPERKVRVIPYGVGPPFTPDGPAAEGDYILAVSTLEPRKNLTRLVEGFRRADLEGLELRLVGSEGWGDVDVDGQRSGDCPGSTTTSSPACTAGPRLWRTCRSTRGSGCRCSRRWPAPRRSWRRPGGRTASSRTG